jgi:hypothetical protein
LRDKIVDAFVRCFFFIIIISFSRTRRSGGYTAE